MNNDPTNKLPVPDNETQRLNVLEQYTILDTLPEEEYDAITKLASFICQVPIALITLLDAERQWFKSKVGLDVPEIPRNISFCQYAILDQQVMEVPDTTHDKRFAANPLVTGETHIRFYAGAPLITPDGFALGTLCVIDTVPKKLSNQQLDALQTLANSVVTQLVLRNQGRKLEEEKEKALQSSRVKEQFLANISHEIRTPLNGIMGLTNLLLASHVTEEQQTFLTHIKQSADTLLAVVNDILDYSKIESGTITLESVPFSLRQLFNYLIQTFRDKAEQKGLRLLSSFDQHIPEHLSGDPGRLKQVLSNLLDNAIKFTEAGQVSIRVKVHSSQESSVTLLFAIQDTGIGIAPDKLSVIFESFIQADNANNRKYGGTGLGLAIAKRLVDVQGGQVWITSEEKEGTLCQVLLPFPVANREGTADKGIAGTMSGSRVRILVAEDNEVNQLIINKILKNRNFEVTLAADGHQVLDILAQQPFDLILMDIQMPGMDGFQAINLIRHSQESYWNIPIIALTAHTAKEEIDKYVLAGANEHVTKPFQPDELIYKIESLVKQNP